MLDAALQILRSAPSEAWVALFGVFVGSLLTTFGVWLTNRTNLKHLQLQLVHDETMHRQRLSKERIEELYILVAHWLHSLFANYLNLSFVMQGKFDYNQYLDQMIKTGNEARYDFNRIEMILDVYGADLRPAYDRVIAARTEANKIMVEHKRSYERGEHGERFLKPFTAAQMAVEEAGETLKELIAEAARCA